MPTPINDIPLITWLWVGGLSLLSGVATYLSRFKEGRKVRRPWLILIYDHVYCLMGGFLTFSLCMAAEFSEWWTVGFVSVGSHMGARLMFQMHGVLRSAIASMLNSMLKMVDEKTNDDES